MTTEKNYDPRNVSVIIPTYNSGLFLWDTLEAVRNQSEGPLEIIVADRPDTIDNTREIAMSCGARVVDGGLPAVGRNAGAEIASGSLLCFLDSDQKLPSRDWLRDAVNEMNARGLDAAGTLQEIGPLPRISGGVAERIARYFNNLSIQAGYAITRAAFGLMQYTPKPAAQQGMLISREAFDGVWGYDVTIFAEDSVIMERIKMAGGRYAILKNVGPIISRVRRADVGGFRHGMRMLGMNVARLLGVPVPIEHYFENKPFSLAKVLLKRKFD